MAGQSWMSHQYHLGFYFWCNKPNEAVSKTLNQLNKKGEAYMKHAEKKCWRFKSGCIPFSMEALLWISQCQVYWYWSLLQWHTGKIWNGKTWSVWHAGVRSMPRSSSLSMITSCIWRYARRSVIIFQKHGKRHRTQHLDTCLKAAQEREDEVAKLQILTIIQGGKD